MLKNVGKLLNFPEYFVKKQKLEILGEYLYLKCLIEQNNINLKLNDTSNMSLEAENYLMSKLLENEQPKNLLIENKQKLVNSSNEIINIEYKGQEENENESCFTEENVLRDINNVNSDFKEKEEKKLIYLNKKRKIQHDDIKDNNNKIINIPKEEVEEILKEIRELEAKNPNNLKCDIDKLNNLELKMTYDDYIESEDDEACI